MARAHIWQKVYMGGETKSSVHGCGQVSVYDVSTWLISHTFLCWDFILLTPPPSIARSLVSSIFLCTAKVCSAVCHLRDTDPSKTVRERMTFWRRKRVLFNKLDIVSNLTIPKRSSAETVWVLNNCEEVVSFCWIRSPPPLCWTPCMTLTFALNAELTFTIS
jgi:hypothetical protein